MKKILLIGLLAISSTFALSQRLSESFESSTAPSFDWTLEYANTSHPSGNTMIHTTDQAFAGSKSFRFSSYSSGSPYDQYLISPLLNVTSADSVVFWYRKSSSSGIEPFRVGVSSTTNVSSSFTFGSNVTNASTTMWQKYSYPVPSGTKYIAIHYSGNYEYYLYIDSLAGPDIYVATCPRPTALMEISTPTTASVSWTHTTPALGYGYEYGVSGFTLGTGTFGTTGVDTANLTGLSPNTTYDFHVAALCAIGDTSIISSFSFTTPCSFISTFPYTENFDGPLTSGVWNCWTVHNIDGGNTWSQSSTYISPRSGSNTAHGMGNNDDYLITPQLTIGTTPIRISFWDIVESSTYNNTYTVRISTTGTAPADFTDSITTIDCSNTSWQEHVIDLSAYTNQNIYVAFHQTYSGATFYGFGIDDFKAELIPTCPKPTALTANSAGTIVTWTHTTTALGYGYEYGVAGFTIGTGTSGITSIDTASLTGLLANTTYDFHVAALCAIGDTSIISSFSFTTPCSFISTFPYTENFDGPLTSGVWNCWSVLNIDGGNTWSQSSTYISPRSGSNTAHGMGNNDDYLISPQFNVGATPIRISFWDIVESSSYNNTYTVKVSTTGTAPADFTDSITTIDCSNTSWLEHIINLPAYTNQNIYVAFHQTYSGASFYGFGIDDFKAELIPNCPEPTTIGSYGETSSSSNVYWIEAGTATTWTVEYGVTGFTLGTGTVTTVTNDTLAISGLMPITSYDVYVRTNCSSLDSSALKGPYTFTTLCGSYSPGYSQDFSSYLPECWEESQGYLTTNTVFSSTTTSNWGSDGYRNIGFSGSARMNIWSTGRKEWLISPSIDLGSGTPYQVEFDVALTDYSGSGTDNMGADDTLAFVISTDNGVTWSSANILRNWVSGDQPANAGERVFLDLSAYSGTVKFGYYAASSVSNTDYNVYIDNFLVTNLCVPTAVSYMDTACGTYTSPSGKIFTTTGIHMDTIAMVRGCDSVLTINLIVNNSTVSITETVCDSYTSPSGVVWTRTGNYMDTIANAKGCDSIISITLTVNPTRSFAITHHACDRFTLPTGVIVTSSGVYVDTISTVKGCDSIVTTTLTIDYTRYASMTVVTCASYTAPSGAIRLTSGTFQDTIRTVGGCDSMITIILTVHPATTTTRTITSCYSYTTPETGATYNTSGTYTDVTTNAYGCTHTITTILTIGNINAGTVSISGATLSVTTTGVSYNWVDCDNDYSFMLVGGNGQSYTPVRNGNFACVVISNDGCRDTTACTSVNSASLDEYVINENNISIFPNPASEFVTIDILNQNAKEDVTIQLFDAVGKLVYTTTVNSTSNTIKIDISKFDKGAYWVSVSNEFFKTTKKLIVVK